MKRFTAILTVLCIAVSLFSCVGGGGASHGSTAAQNTTESIKTESTTSTPEGAGRPQFFHPAAEEINSAIDKAVGAEYLDATVSSFITARKSTSMTSEQASLSHRIVSLQSAGLPERFSLQTVYANTGASFPAESIYFDGSNYYLSRLGASAKIPQSGMAEAESPRALLSAALPKLPIGITPKYEVYEDKTLYSYTLAAPAQGASLSAITDALEKEIQQRTEKSFELTFAKAEISATVFPDGTLSAHTSVLSYVLSLYGAENSVFYINATVSVSISQTDEEKEPAPPENADEYVPLASQNEMALLILKNASERTKAKSRFLLPAKMDIAKKELDGSKTAIALTFQKTFESESAESWKEMTYKKINLSAKPTDVTVCKGGVYYVKNESGKFKYSEADFERLFGCGNISLPECFENSGVISSAINNVRKSTGGSVLLEFELTQEEFTKAFAEHTAKAARYVSGGEEISEFEIKNCRAAVTLSGEGEVESYAIYFDITVNVYINGKKFAFTASVSADLAVEDSLSISEVSAPDDADAYIPYTNEK